MEEIKVGNYIRLDDGTIGIVKYINTQNIGIITNNDEIEVSSGVVSNSSNIIDLIEVGDYVNGKEVVYDVYNTDTIDKHKCIEVSISNDNSTTWTIADTEIKSIVTREAMKSVEYTIE